MIYDFTQLESKQIIVNNIKFTIYNNTKTDIYYSILKQLNYKHITMDNQLKQLKNIITQKIFDNCKNDQTFKHKVYYFINTQWKDKYCEKFPILKTFNGDDLIIKYITLIKNNTDKKYIDLTYGGLIELNEIANYFKINIIIVTDTLNYINNNYSKTIYLYNKNDKYYVCKKEQVANIFSFNNY